MKRVAELLRWMLRRPTPQPPTHWPMLPYSPHFFEGYFKHSLKDPDAIIVHLGTPLDEDAKQAVVEWLEAHRGQWGQGFPRNDN